MATTADGLYLNKYVDPQLLVERRNYKADFMAVLGSVPQSAITADGVRRNKLINNVQFKVNNSQDFTAAAMAGKNVIVPWERYDTTPTSCTEEEIRYLAFDKRSQIRVKHNEAFQVGIRNHILHKLAPANNTVAEMPVVLTTGTADSTGRLRLTYSDLVDYATILKGLNLPNMEELYMVLCPQHMADLLLDEQAAKYFYDRNFYLDPVSGKVRSFMNLKFFENNDTPYYNYTTKVKIAEGTTPAATDYQASVFFYGPNTYYHIDSVKSLYSPETIDVKSASPTSIYRTQTYGIVDRIEDYGVGAIISGKKA